MRIGLNARYVLHCWTCREWLSKSSKLLILTVLLSVFLFSVPVPRGVFSEPSFRPRVQEASLLPAPLEVPVRPAVQAINSFLETYQVETSDRARIADAIVQSAEKYELNPRLIASIMIVESRANPFAISTSDSIGIMQIHLPTWGHTADQEGINLFKIEDNIDFGVRILKDYVRRFGLWDGVKRYKGWRPEDPDSTQAVDEYLAKVQRIAGYPTKPATSE